MKYIVSTGDGEVITRDSEQTTWVGDGRDSSPLNVLILTQVKAELDAYCHQNGKVKKYVVEQALKDFLDREAIKEFLEKNS